MHINEEICTAYTCAYLCQAAPQVGQWTCEVVVAQVQRIQLQQAQDQSLNDLGVSALGHNHCATPTTFPGTFAYTGKLSCLFNNHDLCQHHELF